MTAEMSQRAPYPQALADMVDRCTYREGWQVYLQQDDRGQGSVGLTLTIVTDTVNSYPPHQPMCVRHLFIVPAASYDERSWRRWLFECFHQVELHEAMEFFTIDGEKPYAPSHGPGNDPYLLREVGTDLDQRTSFRGEVKSAEPAVICLECGRSRTGDDQDYNPLQVMTGRPPGWYSGDDGEICGQCMAGLIQRANS